MWKTDCRLQISCGVVAGIDAGLIYKTNNMGRLTRHAIMFIPTTVGMICIALSLEGFLYGLYSAIFVIYLQYQTSKQDTNKTQKILFYSMCALYVTSASIFVCDTANCIYSLRLLDTNDHGFSIFIQMQVTLFACCDFMAQFILIYRCWIVWGRNIWIVIFPSILAFGFLCIWIATSKSTSETLGTLGLPYRMTVTGLALSLIVNALVTGLIVFRILQVFREVKATSDDGISSAIGGSKLRRIILVLIESAMALFSIQLARLVVYTLRTDGAITVYNVIVVTHQMLNGITPTIILVRTSMGLSFHDKTSTEEVAIGTLRFAPNHPNSVPEMGSVGIVGQDIRHIDDDIDVQGSNDINVVER